MLLGLLFFWGVSRPDAWVLLPVLISFIGIPFLDFIFGFSERNPTALESKVWARKRVWMPGPYLYVLSHFAILFYGASQTSGASWLHSILLGVTVGVYTGGIGITVAHELLHRSAKTAKMTADFLLSSMFYPHFAIEHIFGHHFRVATPDDPASARSGETVYRFLIRSVSKSLMHA